MRAQAGLAEDELLQKLAHWETVVAQHARRWEVLYAWVKMLGQLAGMRNDTIRISSPEGAALEELLQAAGVDMKRLVSNGILTATDNSQPPTAHRIGTDLNRSLKKCVLDPKKRSALAAGLDQFTQRPMLSSTVQSQVLGDGGSFGGLSQYVNFGRSQMAQLMGGGADAVIAFAKDGASPLSQLPPVEQLVNQVHLALVRQCDIALQVESPLMIVLSL